VRSARIHTVELAECEAPSDPQVLDVDHLMFVLDGRLTVAIAGQDTVCDAQSLIVIPAGVAHSQWNPSSCARALPGRTGSRARNVRQPCTSSEHTPRKRVPMSRIAIPDVPLESLPAQWQDAEKTGALVNIFRIMLRSPQIATLVVELGAAQFGSGSLPPADRELSILTTAACTDSAYEASQHEQISQSVGVTSSQRAAVAVGQWDSPELSESQQALVAFVAAVAGQPHGPRRRVRVPYSDTTATSRSSRP
jgi:alkylhydroperoxidase family enzyme